MRTIWNGTGSAWSTRYGNASALIEAGGQRLLVDCGHTVPGRLLQMGLTLRDIDAVFISHLHGDHIYGLEEWGFKNLLLWNVKPKLLIAETLADALWTRVLAGTMAQVCDRSCVLSDYFHIIPMREGQSLTPGPWELEIHPVRHVPHALAYGLKVRSEGATVGFTCDTVAPIDPWFYDDTHLVFHDCTFSPPFEETVHAHFDQLCLYPEAFRRKTMLVHYGDDVADFKADAAWQARFRVSEMRPAAPFVPFEF